MTCLLERNIKSRLIFLSPPMYRLKNLVALALLSAAPLAAAVQIDPEPEGVRKMALVYEHGRGVKQDFGQAYRLYCKASLMGDGLSAFNIGFMYFNGRGLPRDHAKALHWFRKAAEAGDEFARRMVWRFRDIAPADDAACREPPAPSGFRQATAPADHPNRRIVAGWVNRIAPDYAIDPELVMAVIQTESAFNPGALSPKNAQGLMQLIPATAERFGVKDPFNPVENIKGGIAYLNWLMRRFAGNVEWVLAAYNAGEGAVERCQGVPPYHETQAYVKKILARYQKTTHPVPPLPSEGKISSLG